MNFYYENIGKQSVVVEIYLLFPAPKLELHEMEKEESK